MWVEAAQHGPFARLRPGPQVRTGLGDERADGGRRRGLGRGRVVGAERVEQAPLVGRGVADRVGAGHRVLTHSHIREEVVVGVLVPVADPDLGDPRVDDPVDHDPVDVEGPLAAAQAPADEGHRVVVARDDVVDAEHLERAVRVAEDPGVVGEHRVLAVERPGVGAPPGDVQDQVLGIERQGVGGLPGLERRRIALHQLDVRVRHRSSFDSPARSRRNPSSSRTGTPRSCAFVSFEPALSPATR